MKILNELHKTNHSIKIILATLILSASIWVIAAPGNPPSSNTPTPIYTTGGTKQGALGVGSSTPEVQAINIGNSMISINPIAKITGDGTINHEGDSHINGSLTAENFVLQQLLEVGDSYANKDSSLYVNKNLHAAEYIEVGNLALDSNNFDPTIGQTPSTPRAVCATAEGYILPCENTNNNNPPLLEPEPPVIDIFSVSPHQAISWPGTQTQDNHNDGWVASLFGSFTEKVYADETTNIVTTVSWMVNNATNCLLTSNSSSEPSITPLNVNLPSGSFTNSVASTTTYRLECSNVDGGTSSRTSTILVSEPNSDTGLEN